MENPRRSISKAPSRPCLVASHQHDWFSRFAMGGNLLHYTHIMVAYCLPFNTCRFNPGQGIHHFS